MKIRQDSLRLTKARRERLSCLILLALIGVTWAVLHKRQLDTAAIAFVYRDF